jgi:hypothetical protein
MAQCTANVSDGSRPCENYLGSPKSPLDALRIGQEDRREQFFPVGRDEATLSEGVLEQPRGS